MVVSCASCQDAHSVPVHVCNTDGVDGDGVPVDPDAMLPLELRVIDGQ